MSTYTPRRWSDLPARPGDPEGEAGRLLKEARGLTGPSALELARIRQRVEARVERQGLRWLFSNRRLTTKSLVSVLVGAAALASVGGAAVVVARAVAGRNLPAPAPTRALVVPELPPPATPAESPVAAPEEKAPEEQEAAPAAEAEAPPRGEVAPGLEPEAPNRPPRLRHHHAQGPRTPKSSDGTDSWPVGGGSSQPQANTLADESALLSLALRQQRKQHDPAAALATLREYERLYPRGALADEAAAAQLQALMSLGRGEEALTLVRHLEVGSEATPARRLELRLVHAELLMQVQRCPEALQLFDETLGLAPSGALQERALFGRATCRAKGGDTEASRVDLQRYLTLFPTGRFAAQARAQLGK